MVVAFFVFLEKELCFKQYGIPQMLAWNIIRIFICYI